MLHDIIGLLGENVPKHANTYINSQKIIQEGIAQYQLDVENHTFPNSNHSTKMNAQELTELKNKIENL